MANPSYIHRFIDIIRSPLGQPLLNQLAGSSDKLAALLYFPAATPPPPAQEPGAPPQEPAPQVTPLWLACTMLARLLGNCTRYPTVIQEVDNWASHICKFSAAVFSTTRLFRYIGVVGDSWV
jgi:hypothetical protein